MAWRAQSGPQLEAIRKHWVSELFFGGAVGGGKSDYLLGDFGQDVPVYGQAWRGILFRRTYGELEELITRSQEIYPEWFPGCEWKDSKSTWVWPNGASLKMRYMEHTTDWMRYWGHQYTWIGWDELPSWPDLIAYNKMKARLRSASPIPNKRIRATGNPGGPGHQAVKAYFNIDSYPLGGQLFRDDRTGTTRLFVRSRLSDNHILLQNDPAYADRLHGLGSPELVRAWLEGDWSVVTGAYFPEFSERQHIIRPIELPKHWTRFRAMDWGSARPFSVGWYAVSDGTIPAFPKGALIRYREWYGASEPNVGLKLPAEKVAEGIKQRETAGEVTYGVLDPAAFAEDGGPSIAERMARSHNVLFRRADNARVSQRGAMGGWDQVRARLLGEDDRPMLYLFSTNTHLIRTLPALQHDETKPEDVNTDGEDHAADELRYACMSRPYARPAPKKPEDMRGAFEMTFNEAASMLDRDRSVHRRI